MARYTKKFIEARFASFCEATGQRHATSYNDVGGLLLDHAPCYGGYEIVCIVNERGAQSAINGWCNRMKAGEIIAFMQGAEYAANLFKK